MTAEDKEVYLKMLSVLKDVRGGRYRLVSASSLLVSLRDSISDLPPTLEHEITDMIITLDSAGVTSSGGILAPGHSINREGVPCAELDSFVLLTINRFEELVLRTTGKPDEH